MFDALEITNRCIDCDICKQLCPENAVIKSFDRYTIEAWACTLCGVCVEACPVECIKLIKTSYQSIS